MQNAKCIIALKAVYDFYKYSATEIPHTAPERGRRKILKVFFRGGQKEHFASVPSVPLRLPFGHPPRPFRGGNFAFCTLHFALKNTPEGVVFYAATEPVSRVLSFKAIIYLG